MRNGLLIALVIVVGIIGNVVAQDSWNVELVGQSWFSPFTFIRDIEIVNNYAFIADLGSGLVIADIQYQTEPFVISNCNSPDQAYRGAISDNFAYVADYAGALRIIDISDLLEPIEICSIETVGAVNAVAVYDDYVLFAEIDEGIHVYNVINPDEPFEVELLDRITSVTDLEISENYIYITDVTGNSRRCLILNISDPCNPVINGAFTFPDFPKAVGIQENYALVASSTTCSILDISNPSAPEEISTFNSISTSDIAISGNYACMASDILGLTIVNIENPEEPIFEYNDTQNNSYNCVAASNNMLITGFYDFTINNIDTPSQPEQTGIIHSNGSACDVEISDQFACLASNSRFQVLDISNPISPLLLGGLNLENDAIGIDIDGNIAYIADWSKGLFVIDFSNPNVPIQLSELCLSSSIHGIDVADNYAYIASASGMYIVDVNDPSEPILTSTFSYPTARGLYISGDYAFLAAGSGGLRIVDISNVSNPTLFSELPTEGNACDVCVSDNFVFIADFENGVRIIDINDLSNPVELSLFEFSRGIVDIEVSGDKVFTANTYGGIHVIDVSDPMNPVETGYFDTSSMATGLQVIGNTAYVADRSYFSIYDCTAADTDEEDIPETSTSLLGNAPNPFNPSTTIRYSLAEAGKVSLCIYNIRGEKVKTLYDGMQDAGAHSHVWDGLDDGGKPVASGVYLSRMQSKNHTATGKMLLLK